MSSTYADRYAKSDRYPALSRPRRPTAPRSPPHLGYQDVRDPVPKYGADGRPKGTTFKPSPALVQLAYQDIGRLSAASQEPAAQARLGTARRLKPDEVDALVAGYWAGKTMKGLAAEFGINRQTVSAHLRRAGVAIRRVGLGPQEAAEVAGLYAAGWTPGDLAERFGVSTDSVRRTLRRLDVPTRTTRRACPRPST